MVLSARLVVRCPGWCLWLPLLRGFGLFCWRGLSLVWLGLSGVSVCWLFLAVFSFLRLAFVGFALRQSGQGHLYILLSPVPLRPSLIIVLVCLSADWTGSPVLLTSTGPPRLSFTVIV